MTRRIGLLLLMGAVLAACRTPPPAKKPSIPAEARPVPDPTPERPIVAVYLGKTGVYDLLFGGRDGRARTWRRATKDMAMIAFAPDFKSIAVLEHEMGKASGRLAFYDSDGRETGAADVPILSRYSECRFWISERREAIVLNVAYSHVEEHPGRLPRRKPELLASFVEAGGAVKPIRGELLDALVDSDVAFAKTSGLALLRSRILEPEDPGRIPLIRYSAPDKVAWRKRLMVGSWWFRPPKEGADLTISWIQESGDEVLAHFQADGTFRLEERAFDPEAWRKANPGYKERAGKFYEKEDLPSAVEALAKAVPLSAKEKGVASEIFRWFVYDWLTAFEAGGYKNVQASQARRLEEVDRRFREALVAGSYARYLEWRKEEPPPSTGRPGGGYVVRRLLRETQYKKIDLEALVLPAP